MAVDLRLRLATEKDLPVLLTIQHGAPTAPQWNEELWRALFSPEASRRAIWVAEDAELMRGFVVMHLAAGIAEIESLAVDGAWRRCGIGRMLYECSVQWAREHQAAVVELEVRESNAAAIGLYRSLGFAEQGRRRAYYHEPVEDAVLMARKL